MGDLHLNIEGPRNRARQVNNLHIENKDGGCAGASGGSAENSIPAVVKAIPDGSVNVHANSTKEFDVFLCHNSRDKEIVKEIAGKLRERRIIPWLDEWELRPGVPWQPVIESMILQGKAAAVFIGSSGLGPWQDAERQAFIQEFQRRELVVIPVILPDVRGEAAIPVFLRSRTFVDFRKTSPDPMEMLIFGITGDQRGRRFGSDGSGFGQAQVVASAKWSIAGMFGRFFG